MAKPEVVIQLGGHIGRNELALPRASHIVMAVVARQVHLDRLGYCVLHLRLLANNCACTNVACAHVRVDGGLPMRISAGRTVYIWKHAARIWEK